MVYFTKGSYKWCGNITIPIFKTQNFHPTFLILFHIFHCQSGQLERLKTNPYSTKKPASKNCISFQKLAAFCPDFRVELQSDIQKTLKFQTYVSPVFTEFRKHVKNSSITKNVKHFTSI